MDTFRRNIQALAALLFMAAFSVSCSVKEDRSGIPVWLVVNSGTFNPLGCDGDVTFLAWEKGGAALTQTVRTGVEPLVSHREEMRVSKGRTWVSFVGGVEDMDYSRDSLLIAPYGCQCDSLVVAAESFETYAEEYYLSCMLQRQFIGVNLHVKYNEFLETCPYTLHVKGNVCGVNVRSLAPVKGDFLYVPTEDVPFRFSFRLPRQSDYSAVIEIWGRDDGESREVYFGTFDLGGALGKLGYDIAAADLKPVDLTMDFVRGAVSVTVEDWTEVFVLKLKI